MSTLDPATQVWGLGTFTDDVEEIKPGRFMSHTVPPSSRHSPQGSWLCPKRQNDAAARATGRVAGTQSSRPVDVNLCGPVYSGWVGTAASLFAAVNAQQICLPPLLFSLPGEQKFPADYPREFAKEPKHYGGLWVTIAGDEARNRRNSLIIACWQGIRSLVCRDYVHRH
jgi:hypothetical protein